MICNLCGDTRFLAQGARPHVRCAGCNSLERTRLLWLYLSRLPMGPSTRVLHLAPERGLYTALSKRLSRELYDVTDIDPAQYPFASQIRRLDLCSLDNEPSDHYDFIVHSHVLEHIPCNIAYTLYHLHRMLKPEGRHVCVIPFLPGDYDECFAEIGPAERQRRFGQDDHVRKFGRDDVARHLGSLLRFDADFDATRDFSTDQLRSHNIPESAWRALTIHTVLQLRKFDMKLLAA